MKKIEIPADYANGRHTMELRLPYMTPGAVHRLDAVLHPDQVVIEVGAGGSTLFFAERCKRVIVLEPRSAWADCVVARCRELGLDNVHVFSEEDPKRIVAAAGRLGAGNVVSVDCDRRFNRDEIQAEVIDRSSELLLLQVVVVDNYAAPIHFPDTANLSIAQMIKRLPGKGWEGMAYDDPAWSGRGTRIFERQDLGTAVTLRP